MEMQPLTLRETARDNCALRVPAAGQLPFAQTPTGWSLHRGSRSPAGIRSDAARIK
jgi:hypothetical protein